MGLALWAGGASADEFTSTSFKLLDPAFQAGQGEQLSSDSFRLFGSVAQIAIGTSSSANFQVKGGFLYIAAAAPAAPTPAPSPTPAASQGEGVLESVLREISAQRPRRVIPSPGRCEPPTDLNCDGKIGLSDLSILLYLLGRDGLSVADFNSDQVVDLLDLSILFTRWSERVVPFAREDSGRSLIAERQTAAPQDFASIGKIAFLTRPKPASGFVGSQVLEAGSRSLRSALGRAISFFRTTIERLWSWWMKW